MYAQNQYAHLRHLALSVNSFWNGKTKLMGIYTGYFDEGNDEESPQFIMGGLTIDAEKTALFDGDWLDAIACLPHFKGSPHLHTTDFVGGNGIYDPEWKGRYGEKLAILSRAAKVIHKYAVATFTCVLDMEDFCFVNDRVKLSEAIGHPYALAARLAYQQLRVWSCYRASSNPVMMIVEARKGFGEVSDLFLRDDLPVPKPEGKELCALQAADYIAWIRARKCIPTKAYLAVRDSWKETNQFLHMDHYCNKRDYVDILVRHQYAHDVPLPLLFRDAPQPVIFNGNTKRPRRAFRRRRKAV